MKSDYADIPIGEQKKGRELDRRSKGIYKVQRGRSREGERGGGAGEIYAR